MKFTEYFRRARMREDREMIRDEWIAEALKAPLAHTVQKDGRIRLWVQVEEAGGRYLRVVVLEDRLTVHNAFFDRNFRP